MSELIDLSKRRGFDLEETAGYHQVEKALEEWLGADLQVLEDAEHPGRPLWDGEENNLRVRRATDEEAAEWQASLAAAIKSGEQEPGDTEWLVYLIRVIDPMNTLGDC